MRDLRGSGESEPVEAAVRQILVEMGEDPDREGLAARRRACGGCTAS